MCGPLDTLRTRRLLSLPSRACGRLGALLTASFRSFSSEIGRMQIRTPWVVRFTSLVLLFTGCGKTPSKASPPPPPVDPATAASISGTVKFAGTPPVYSPIDMSASPACVKANPSPVVPPVVVTGKHDALANVVVFVKSGLGHYRYPVPRTPVTLDQKGCMYDPHVVALMVGQSFHVANSDPTLHDVHPLLRNNPSWDTSQLPGTPPMNTTFAGPEFADPIVCMIHPWMRGYLFVFDQPYFAVTSKDGIFALKNLPPGNYTIEAWHEPNQTLDQTVELGPRNSKTISFTFQYPSIGG
jgi:plastocyanin